MKEIILTTRSQTSLRSLGSASCDFICILSVLPIYAINSSPVAVNQESLHLLMLPVLLAALKVVE